MPMLDHCGVNFANVDSLNLAIQLVNGCWHPVCQIHWVLMRLEFDPYLSHCHHERFTWDSQVRDTRSYCKGYSSAGLMMARMGVSIMYLGSVMAIVNLMKCCTEGWRGCHDDGWWLLVNDYWWLMIVDGGWWWLMIGGDYSFDLMSRDLIWIWFWVELSWFELFWFVC